MRIHEPTPSLADWPSYLYLTAFVLNTAVLVVGGGVFGWDAGWRIAWLLPSVVIQGFFFMGVLELMHQSVHYNFVTHRGVNEAIGSVAAALIGINLVAYRFFHLEHHRHTCDEDDPEGILYAQSPATRWMALGSPIEHTYVALQINHLARRYVPQRKQFEWRRARVVLALTLSLLGVAAYLAPVQFLVAYLLPLCVFAWMDFFFSQAEHYGADIRPRGASVDVRAVSWDVVIPAPLSYLMLNRNLHTVHHVWPRTRWFETPQRVALIREAGDGGVITFTGFMRKWLQGGPRLWRKPDLQDDSSFRQSPTLSEAAEHSQG
ncbi:MAG: fatty acid desaturase [Ketobacter sp.]|nr:fatty acid desaturase [Ketobacter sp.]